MNSRDLGKFLVLLALLIISGLVSIAIVLAFNGSSLAVSIVTGTVLSSLGAIYPSILESSFFESFVDLLESLFFRSSEERDRSGKRAILKQETIINMYYKQQNREVLVVFIVILITLVACSAISVFLEVQLPIAQISLILFVLLVLLYLKKLFIEYRIIKGYFGTNRYEATEIIRFVEKNIDKLDSSGGGGLRVFPSMVLETSRTELSSQDSGEDF
ncbi:MAG: hypothetical protein HC899_36545 [Leptolyngbyaceae cyanobacterium SM1_4_3]|nr:hypothetical protein [Leptolyngbyaceae cyanobacterium SM1_4_3]